MTVITHIQTLDVRFPLPAGAGTDAIHSNPHYSYAVTLLHADAGTTGVGLAFTLGGGNDLVCRAVETLAEPLVGREIGELMGEFGQIQRDIANHPQLRWLGPHKGLVHLALSSIVNACFDLWAKERGVPLWRLLLDLTPQELVQTLDFSYLEDILTPEQARATLEQHLPTRETRTSVIREGYPGYDTSVGWFHYEDDVIREKALRAVEQGFTALKLKVGSKELERDVRRAHLVRSVVGESVRVMLDVNQQWTLPQALRASSALRDMSPFWIEEPTHPDDVLAHQTLAREIAPVPIALGEHVPNRVLFKNFMQAQAVEYVQVDAVRVAGISEFIVVSLLARQFGLKVVPHVGDMGQIHQHLVLFNHIALGLDKVFLEYIPHLRNRFVCPAVVTTGVYQTPQEAGSSSDLITL